MLSAAMLFPVTSVFSENSKNYEYILPMEYVRIERLQNSYIAYDKQEKCAIYDRDGKKLSDDYDYIGSFFNDTAAAAKKGNEYYIINPYGTVLSKFDKRIIDTADYVLVNLTDSNEDGRPSSYFEGEFGVYTYTGELVKVLPYDKFKPNKNDGFWLTIAGGRLLFRENGKWGAVDSSFNTAIEPVYDKIYPFTDLENGITIAIINGKYGLIDSGGNTVADFVYDTIEPLFQGGKVNAYKVMQGYAENNDEKYGLLDKYGKMIKQLDEAEPQVLYEDYKLIEVSADNTRDDSDQYGSLYGLIDYDGNVIVPVENTNIWGISEGIAAVQKAYDQCGYYDLSGNEITGFKYRMTSLFSEGLAFTASCINDVWTYEVINQDGEVVFKPSGFANGFYGGIAEVETGRFIDTSGKTVIDNPEWKTSSDLNWWSYKNDGRFIVSDGENYGVAKYTGFISPWARETVSKAQQLNLINADGNYNYTAFITREEFCGLIFNYIESFSKPTFSEDITKSPFTDTDNRQIAMLNSIGIIKGKSETAFAPNDFLTREEAAVILHRLIKKIYPDSAATEIYFNFADSEQISDWAASSIQVICNMGIMKGIGENNFAPQDLYTTEQAVATLVRVYDNLAASNGMPDTERLVDESFMVLSLPWGEKWENLKDRDVFSTANIVADDGNRFVVELEDTEFLGTNGKMILLFSVPDDSFPFVGLVKAYFTFDETAEKDILAHGTGIYGERKSYFLDRNGLENPLSPSAWYSSENMDNSLSADERAYFEKILKDKNIEETRADAIIRGPLVVISVNETDNVITIDGDNAANVFNLRNYPSHE